MRILHVYKDYYPPVKGGIECHMNILANALTARGVHVSVLVANRSAHFQVASHNRITVAKAPQWGRWYSAPITPFFFRYLRRFGKNVDIIHFHYPNPTAEFSYLLTHLERKTVLSYHSDIIRQQKLEMLYAPFRRVFMHAMDRIIVSSPNIMQSSDTLKPYRHKCRVIPYGIDVHRFEPSRSQCTPEAIKRKHGNKPIILFVGRFRYYKGLHLLIAAMKNIEASLLLIGTGPEESRLRTMVQQGRLQNKITFLGDLSDELTDAYYNACDIFVLPSHLRSEAFGIVQIEAMCCGKPVVSTELGTGTSYANIDRETGLTVRPNDSEALSGAINFLLNNPRARMQMGSCGANRVKQLFSSERMTDQILALYEDLMKA
jgi:rhamnosyl/mannosyltransferase